MVSKWMLVVIGTVLSRRGFVCSKCQVDVVINQFLFSHPSLFPAIHFYFFFFFG